MVLKHVILSTPSLGVDAGGPARSVSGAFFALHPHIPDLELWHGTHGPSIVQSPAMHRYSPQQLIHRGLRVLSKSSVVHDSGLWSPWNLGLAQVAQLKGSSLVVSPRGMLSPWALQQKKWKKRIGWSVYQKRILASAKLVVVTSLSELAWVRDNEVDTPSVVIPNGIDLPTLEPSPSGRGSYALFLSRLYPGKGLEDLIESWGRLRPAMPLYIAGSGTAEYESALQKEVIRLGLSDAITFLGHVEGVEKWKLLADATVFVLPSHSENFGMVVAEALAAGTPVITTHGTPWEDLEARGCGWWVPVGVDPLSELLRDVLAKPQREFDDMGARGRAWMAASFSWDSIAQQTLIAYDWVASGAQRRGAPRILEF